MDKKQCERMFEQMQPPKAVVQRLQQRIHAEEAASLAEQQPNRSSSKLLHTHNCTTAPQTHSLFFAEIFRRCSCSRLSAEYGNSDWLSSETWGTSFCPLFRIDYGSIWNTKNNNAITCFTVSGTEFAEMAVVNPDRVEVQDMLGEGSLMGADGATTVSVYQVYWKDTATIEESVCGSGMERNAVFVCFRSRRCANV